MAHKLTELIQASGYSGTAGQSFPANVSGAGPGVFMTGYFCGGWDFSGEPAPELIYSDNATFNVTVSFSKGAFADYILRLGSGKITINPGLSPTGFTVSSSSSLV